MSKPKKYVNKVKMVYILTEEAVNLGQRSKQTTFNLTPL